VSSLQETCQRGHELSRKEYQMHMTSHSWACRWVISGCVLSIHYCLFI